MKKIKLILLLILYSINSNSQKPLDIIKEDRIENDTVVWMGSKSGSLSFISVKADHDSIDKCPRRKPKDMSIEAYEGKFQNFLRNYISCKSDSLSNIFLIFFPKTIMNKLLNTSSRCPILVVFRITESGEIFYVDIGIRNDIQTALSSSEYYKIQDSLKKNVTFKAPASYGATGCITFSLPITKKHIQAKLSNSNTYIHSD